MARVLVLGAGLGGLTTAMLLARDGHQVTVLERDPAPPPDPSQAWPDWQRRGVSQFRLPHYSLPRWRVQVRAEFPEVLDDLLAAGAVRVNPVTALPASRRGPVRDTDERFDAITARRPVLEAVLAAAADRTPGLTVRRGVTTTGLLPGSAAPGGIPRVVGVLTEGGRAVPADLVVDCAGRRSPLGSWLAAIGAMPPVEEREDSGFVYFGRHFRTTTGSLPEVGASFLQAYDSVSILTLPSDNGTWSVTFAASSRDRDLRGLRDPAAWDAALARYPLAAHWRDGTPISGVEVIAGIEDRYRRLVRDGRPVATGVVAVGDAWACTNPSLGRGAAIGLCQARVLRDVVRETGTDDPEKLVRRFDEATAATVEPMYRATLWFDRHRLAEIDADIAGTPYRTEDRRWLASKALSAASLVDADLTRAVQSIASLLATADEVFAAPGVLDRVMALGAGAPRYPLPGPDRATLLAAIGA